MISAETRAQYTVTIGIECHVQLKTKTKLFAAVGKAIDLGPVAGGKEEYLIQTLK